MKRVGILKLKALATKALALETGEHTSFCAYHGGYACTCQSHALYRHHLAAGTLKLIEDIENDRIIQKTRKAR